MSNSLSCDLAIIGGGLAGGLIALAFATRRPDLDILLIEREATLGGNHLWSFFDGDVADADRWLVDPLVAHRWPGGHDVAFPGHRRTLATPYNSITSSRFDAHLRTVLGDRAITGAAVADMTAHSVTLADGRMIAAQAVIDARGGGDLGALRCGWQKFVGQTLRLGRPHGIDRPVIMDASVPQIDGYRFVYLLPVDPHTIFVEDTYYSDSPALDEPAVAARIAAYAQARGWTVKALVHSESGILPVVHGGDFDRFWPRDAPVARAGVRAGLFHPMTGYSLPDGVNFALWLVEQPLATLPAATRARAAAHWRAGGYYRLLGRMLFGAAAPDQRWRIFERFYRLPAPLIQRFYAGRSRWTDRARILCGRPPVPIRSAMRVLTKHSA
ncbi:lycopene beta-cyclase CrtY [Sphingobium sp. AN641]|uniref:lycopene beta-cyclase CrtY n=1 Tax=Sphingobium sp. AN641 TaxID=3133443 RepID=UPI0030C204BF